MTTHETRMDGRQTRQLSRRGLMQTAGGVALTATVAPFAATTSALASVPMQGTFQSNYRRIKLGEFEVTTVFDGYANVPRVFPIFGQNQSVEAVTEHMQANFLPGDKMQIGFTPIVVNTGSDVVLFDAGNGSGRGETRGRLVEALASAGFSPEQITIVVITHYHPDHIGGLLTEDQPTFPNARYVTGAAENNYWTSDAVTGSSDDAMQQRSALVQSRVVPLAAKTTFIDPGADVVTGITAVSSFGHTPGHMAYNIESGGQRLLLWADACNHYVASLQKPEWHVVFDMDKDAAIASRKAILGMAAADKILATGYHMPFPSLGYVEAVGDAFRWVPLTYQMEL